MKPEHIAVSLLGGTKTGEKILSSQRYRVILFATAALTFNLLYALYYCVLGVMNLSLWFISMCAFYGILATMRFSAILYGWKNHELSSDETERFVMKFSGTLLIILSLILAAVNYISLSQNIATKYEEIIMITIATYTFCKITMAIMRAVKQHKNPSLLLSTIRRISYAEVAAAILTLQRSMLVSFGSMNSGQIRLMNSITGAGVCLFVLTLGISMIMKSTGKENDNDKIKTCSEK